MSKIIRAIVFIIILYFINDLYRYSSLSGIIDIALIAAYIYLIVAVINFIRRPSTSNKNRESTTPGQANNYSPNIPVTNSGTTHFRTTSKNQSNKNTGGLLVFAIVVIIALIILLREILGQFSLATFAFIDGLLKFNESMPPILGWMILGLLVGAIYGSVVAWKKYNLSFSINLIPIGGFLLIAVLLFIINKPFADAPARRVASDIEPSADSSIYLPSKKYIVNRWVIVDILGKNKENYQRNINERSEFEFKKNGKCYLNENGIRKLALYYTVSSDGRSILFSNPNNSAESRQMQIISISKNDLVLKSELFQNDTAILKAR